MFRASRGVLRVAARLVRTALRYAQEHAVIEMLEKGGFIARTGKREKWDLAPRGRHMVLNWKSPRRFTPAIERDEEPDVCGEIIESVPCSILRSQSDH
jgi:hypothetical protein